MAQRNAGVVSAAAVVLGTIAVALNFVAYAKRIKAEDVSRSSDGICKYPSSPASGVGIVAALMLVAEQIVISVGTGCLCCGPSRSCPSTCAPITALVFFVLSWLTFVIAFIGLIVSAIVNNNSFLANAFPGSNNGEKCYNIHKDSRLFLGAAIWCIISIVLGLLSYFILRASTNRSNQNGNLAYEQGFAMGQTSVKGESIRN